MTLKEMLELIDVDAECMVLCPNTNEFITTTSDTFQMVLNDEILKMKCYGIEACENRIKIWVK